jgi:hypothetical protein
MGAGTPSAPPIPDFPIPLLREDPEPALPLNMLLHELYDRAGYDLMVNYAEASPLG